VRISDQVVKFVESMRLRSGIMQVFSWAPGRCSLGRCKSWMDMCMAGLISAAEAQSSGVLCPTITVSLTVNGHQASSEIQGPDCISHLVDEKQINEK